MTNDKVLLLYWSKTGNTQTFVDHFVSQSSLPVDVYDMKRSPVISSKDVKKYSKIVIGSYTWGYGKIPEPVKSFIVDNVSAFQNKTVFLFGSGNSIYPKFCGAIDNIEVIMNDIESEVYAKVKIDQRFNVSDYTEEQLSNINKSIKKFSEVSYE